MEDEGIECLEVQVLKEADHMDESSILESLDDDDEGSGNGDDEDEEDKELEKYEDQSGGDDDKSSQFEADH